ncbi:MAG: gamma carbonic anhydrase family protein [Bacillota bacterium]
MNLVEYGGKKPVLANRIYIDPQATLIGDIIVEDGVGIWPGAVIRADEAQIVLKNGAMLLENAVVEAAGGTTVTISSNSIISHGAIVHGAQVGSGCIIGIGAMVLDNARIGNHSIIGSGALVAPNKEIPEKSLVIGLPGKVVREIDSSDLQSSRKEWETLNNKLDQYIKIRGGTR